MLFQYQANMMQYQENSMQEPTKMLRIIKVLAYTFISEKRTYKTDMRKDQQILLTCFFGIQNFRQL